MSKENKNKEDFTEEELFMNKGLAMVPIPVDNIQFLGSKVKELLREYAKIKSRERAIAMSQWATHNDWLYIPSKDCWVNEEEEERDTRLTNDQFFNLYLKSKQP
jgi:hypothetical protein